MVAPEASHAAGPPNFSGVPVGTAEPTGLPVRSPLQQRITDLKVQIGQMVGNHQQVPQALLLDLRNLTQDPSIGTTGPSSTPFSGITPNYLYNGVYYATVDPGVSNYVEPSTLPSILQTYGSAMYNNMCGPGSATKLLSHYIPSTINSYYNPTFSAPGVTSPQGYITYLAAGAPDPGGTSYAH